MSIKVALAYVLLLAKIKENLFYLIEAIKALGARKPDKSCSCQNWDRFIIKVEQNILGFLNELIEPLYKSF